MNDLFHIYGRGKFIDWAIERISHQDEWFSETDMLLLDQKQKDIDIYVEEKKQANKEVYRSVG